MPTVTTEQTLLAAVKQALLLPNTATATPNEGNTGTGVVANIQVGPPALVGSYVIALTAPDAFTVTDPAGHLIGDGVPGTIFAAAGLSLVVMPGGVAFVAGDGFSVVVPYPTSAGANVFMPKDWPTSPNQAGAYPCILIYWPKETKTSKGPNAPLFDVSVTVRLVARVVSKPGKGDAGANACLAAVGVIKRQIEVSVINNFALYKLIAQISSIDTNCEVKNLGEQHIGELVMDMALEYTHATGDFAPINTYDISQIAIWGDLLDIFDADGAYVPPFNYPVTDAPRTVGPDGRVEVSGSVTLPTD